MILSLRQAAALFFDEIFQGREAGTSSDRKRYRLHN